MKEQVGIGIIGTGFARKVQIPGFSSVEGCKVISIASAHLENARTTAEEFGVKHFTDDWRETVSREDVDLVCITTPPVLHREMALFAIEHGKHILCEKPMAMNSAEAEEMTAAAEKANVIAIIDHELRFLPGRQKAFAMLRNGAIGKVRHAKYNFRAAYRGNRDLRWNWWSDIEQGGGALGAIDSHVVDSLLWLLGTDITSVFCQMQTHVLERRDSEGKMRPVTSDDQADMLIRFADSDLTENATGLIACSMSEPPEYMNRVELFGEKGSMRIDNLGELYIADTGETDWARVEVEEPVTGSPNDNGFARGFKYIAPKIVEAIRKGRNAVDGAATFADGVKVQQVLDAARESNAERRAIELNKSANAADFAD
jgi:predicted dehydrogenase